MSSKQDAPIDRRAAAVNTTAPGGMSRAKQELNQQSNTHSNGVPGGNMLRRALPIERRLKVCVVGAGVSGMRAATKLLEKDVEVTVLEARDRVGGRMGQSSLNGNLVDLGPNWIHGTADNPVLDLAKLTNTTLHSWDERQKAFDFDKTPVPEDELVEAAEGFWGIVSDAFKHSNGHCENIPVEESLTDFITMKAKGRYSDGDQSDEVQQRKQRLLLEESKMWGNIVAGSTDRQSLRFMWLEECIEGENVFVAETYHKVLDAIAQPLEKVRGLLRLKTPVSEIEYDEEKGQVNVTTASGTHEIFDEVIVTTPLGWLKQNKQAFQPRLPDRLETAIDAIGYGNLDKVYFSFRTAFWDDPSACNGAPIAAVRSKDLPNTTATTAPLHNADEGSSNDDEHYPGFTTWYSPDYTQPTNPHRFNIDCMNLAALPTSCDQPTLLFYVAGDCAKFLSQLQTSASSASEAKQRLTNFFMPYISLLPNYDSSNPDCALVDLLFTNWAADQYAGFGSYCNFQIGLEQGDNDIEVMRQGMPERRTWLAGEHTAPFVALGTVTGAWWSGEAVADRILRTYGIGGPMASRVDA